MITSAMARRRCLRAMNVLDGTVIGPQTCSAIGNQEFIRFLNAVEREVPPPARPSMRSSTTTPSTSTPATSTPRSENGWARHPRWTFHFHADLGFLTQRRRGLLRDPPPSAVSSAASSNPWSICRPPSNRFLDDHNAQVKALPMGR